MPEQRTGDDVEPKMNPEKLAKNESSKPSDKSAKDKEGSDKGSCGSCGCS